MKRALILTACILLSLLLAAPVLAGDDSGRRQVTFTERDVKVLRVKAPRPEVTYLLLRAKLDDGATRPKLELAPRIERALDTAPF